MLNNALDMGITEKDFWESTLGEINRATLSKQRVLKAQYQQDAVFNYMQASLFRVAVASVLDSSVKFPEIQQVYPTLFDAQEIEEEKAQKLAEISAIRFKEFALAHNKKFGNNEVSK